LLSIGYSIPVVNWNILNDVYMYNLQFIIENFDEAKELISRGRLNEIVMNIINSHHSNMDFFDTENFKILMTLCLKLKIFYHTHNGTTYEYDSEEFFNYMDRYMIISHEKTKSLLFIEKYKKIIKEIKEEKKDGKKRNKSKRRSKKKSKRRSKKRSKRKM